jgi:mono/diheme cytochrome c family protein
VGVLAGLVLLGGIGLYGASERVVRRTYDVPLSSIALPDDPAELLEGQRLARLRGCVGGCHGQGVEGGLFYDEPKIARIVAPNLTEVVREYTDAELERVIRRGVRRDGRSVFAMPSPMFAHLSDEDLGRIIAFLRNEPAVDGPAPVFALGPLGRVGLVTRQFPPLAEEIPALTSAGGHTAPALRRGEYLALTVCTECHGQDLRGSPEGNPPDLAIAGAYSDDEFRLLMSTGIGLGGRDLGLMSEVARSRFSYLYDDEVHDLHAYLKTLGAARQVVDN